MSVLLIHHTSVDDSGLYKCEVANKLGSTFSTATVIVTGKSVNFYIPASKFRKVLLFASKKSLIFADVRAHFTTSFPEYLEIDEGTDAVFSCELSDADASVVWFRDGKPLLSDERVIIEEREAGRRLIIKNATVEDSGEYECATTDKKSRSQAELVVRGHWLVSLFGHCLLLAPAKPNPKTLEMWKELGPGESRSRIRFAPSEGC